MESRSRVQTVVAAACLLVAAGMGLFTYVLLDGTVHVLRAGGAVAVTGLLLLPLAFHFTWMARTGGIASPPCRRCGYDRPQMLDVGFCIACGQDPAGTPG